MKITIQGLLIEDVTIEEAKALIAQFGPDANGASSPGDVVPYPTAKAAAKADKAEPVKNNEPKIVTANKAEALLRFYEEIKIVDHQRMLRVLAAAGSKGLDQDQLKKRSGMTWLAGFTNAITKRTKAYGLSKADVLTVEEKGTLAAKRIQQYRLTPEMLAVMREHNYVESGTS